MLSPAKPRRVNVADRLTAIAERMPDAIAIATPGGRDVAGQNGYTTCTFAQLDRDATALAHALVQQGVTPGMRLVLMVRPGVEFVKLVFALLRCGATTVMIDPGMGRKHLLNCLAAAEPDGFVAISLAQAVRKFYARRFPRARLNVTVGRRWFWGGPTYRQLLATGESSTTALPRTQASDPAAIIFTSGSTGPPKGVLYTHEMFDTQASEIQREYDIQPGGADLSCFALFGLFNSVMGVTTVFPQMDFARPASADPRKLLAAADDWRITQAFASPAVWDKLSRYCQQQGEQIPTLRKVFSCGAPVPAEVMRRTLACVSADGEMHTPYGATESLPVATIAASEVFAQTAEQTSQGKGVCVGRKFSTVDWKVIAITDEPIATIDEVTELPPGEIGELIVRGPQVSPAYVVGCGGAGESDQVVQRHNARAKIAGAESASQNQPAEGAVWHRMGDVGYFDLEQRFWYCGRKNHRVTHRNGDIFTIPIEAVFNTLPNVKRSALVGIGPTGNQQPVVVIEMEGKRPGQKLYGSLWEKFLSWEPKLEDLWYGTNSVHKNLESLTEFPALLSHPSLPVDVRHNSKINREALAAWAETQINDKQSKQ